MNHYQQQYFANQQTSHPPQAPISPYYAARQRFEQASQAAQAQAQALEYQQRPPQHPQQQQRAGTHQHPQLRAQTQARPEAQAQAHSYGRPQTHYAQPLQQPYQPQYQGSQQMREQMLIQIQAQMQARFAPQYPQQVAPPIAPPYAQRTFSFPPPQAQIQAQPAQVPYQTQQQYAAAYNAQSTHVYTPQQQQQRQPQPQPQPQPQQAPQYGRAVGPPQGSSDRAQPSADSANAGNRRPLPMPSQARPRPISMPPQPTQSSNEIPPARIINHSSSSSLSHMIPQSSIRPTTPLPTSSFPAVTDATSPKRRPLPSPSPSSDPIPLPPASPRSAQQTGISRPADIQLGRVPSPEKHTPLSSTSTAAMQAPGSSLQRITTQRRALPLSPTAPPDLSQLQRGAGTLARAGTVTQMVSRFGRIEGGNQVNSGAEKGIAAPPEPAVHTPSTTSAHLPRSPIRSSTLPANVQSAPPDHYPQTLQRSSPLQTHVDEDDVEDGQDRKLSATFESAAVPAQGQTRSPQYGIRDLPKRNIINANSFAQETVRKPEPPSPQYGIKDLPMRAKSVIDRRRAWERAEQSMNVGTSGISSSGSRSAFEPGQRLPHQPPSPTKVSAPSSPEKVSAAALRLPKTKIAPPRSPQPQTPRQEQKLPMPAVRHPQPSYTDRQPSWTLPTADLEKIGQNKHPDGRKTSMAFRMATMSLSEEDNIAGIRTDKFAAPSSSQAKLPSRPLAQSGASAPTSPKKPYMFGTRTPRAVSNMDLNLDDAPPPSLRRSPSPAISATSSSVPSIPTIRTPDDGSGPPSGQHQRSYRNGAPVPKVNLPDDFDYDDNVGSVPSVRVQAPGVVVSPKPVSPRNAAVPMINFPDDDGPGPIISVSAPASQTPTTQHVPMPVILDDLARPHTSPTKSRGLPRPPGASPGFVPASSSSGSNVRSRGGGLVCGGCQESILGRIVSAMGLRWHPQCFKCCTCGELLEHVSSYENDGKPYCHLDYHDLFAPQCYHCKTPIIDERFITLDDPALGKRTYHEQHFFCAECGDPFLAPSAPSLGKPRAGPNEINIQGDGAFDLALDEDGSEVGFTVYRGHPYCETCHVRLRAPKCKGCKRSIRDGMRAVEALGGKWCFECFVCAGCQEPFEEPSFFQRGQKPFCEPCFSVILRNEL